MNTRHQETAGPLSQNRYMSSPEFAELRGVNGVAVSARAAVVVGKQKQELLWWLQGRSLAEGGFNRLAKEIVEMFPQRLRTEEMYREKIDPEKTCPGDFVRLVKSALSNYVFASFEDDECDPETGAQLIARCYKAALHRHDFTKVLNSYTEKHDIPSLEEFFVDLCINPRLYFSEPGEAADVWDAELEKAIDEHPELTRSDFETAGVPYFKDIIGALFEYKSRSEKAVRESFYLTEIGKQVWDTLDFALARGRMVVLDGLEGRGKTAAVKAWCAVHGGQARFASLKGITSKTTAFREMARTLGIASSYTRNASEMMERAQDVLRRSKLMLVIDEAHFAFSQSNRVSSRPELVDWIDTALCNQGIPVALVTTPQFIICMTRAADKVNWNYRQFRRRVARWLKLPDQNSEADIKGVARSVFKNASEQMISKIAGYALLSKRDLSAVGDVADEVRAALGTEDLSKATLHHVDRAIHESLLPCDEAFLKGMAAARGTRKKRLPAPVVFDSPIQAPESPAETEPTPRNRVAESTAPAPVQRHAGRAELVTE